MILTVNNYADFKAAAGAVTKPSVVYNFLTSFSPPILHIDALANEGTVFAGVQDATVTAQTVQSDFPHVVALPGDFGVTG